jgi:hypothetical protein
MQDQASLRILLHRPHSGAGSVGVSVMPPAPLPIGRLFAGQKAAEAVERAALVFNICGAAQAAATGAALGVPPARDAGRRMLTETLRDHAVKLAVLWPEALGMTPDATALGAVSALAEDRGAALGRALLGADGLPADLAGFETWLDAADTAPARVLARLWRGWEPRWGAVTLPLWPGLSPSGLDLARAMWHGAPFETGLPAIHAAHPLLRAIATRQGRSLVWRLAARLVDAAAALDALAGRAPLPAARALGPGVGVAPAARGTMLVQGQLERGRVTALARLSPTDVALHEDGLMARALATLPAEPDAPLEAVARLVIEAVDPCLPYQLAFAPAAAAGPTEETPHVHRLRLLG